jgi:hypothetical protein
MMTTKGTTTTTAIDNDDDDDDDDVDDDESNQSIQVISHRIYTSCRCNNIDIDVIIVMSMS